MPPYDPVKYPRSLLPKISQVDAGDKLGFGDNRSERAEGWPASPHIPDDYLGPPASREFETAIAPTLRAFPVPAVTPPTEAPGAPPIDAPPGSKPHPL